MLKISALSGLLFGLCAGCVTAPALNMTYHSDPEGATLYERGRLWGSTPLTLTYQESRAVFARNECLLLNPPAVWWHRSLPCRHAPRVDCRRHTCSFGPRMPRARTKTPTSPYSSNETVRCSSKPINKMQPLSQSPFGLRTRTESIEVQEGY